MKLVYDNINISRTQQIENLMPFCYHTDGGTYNDDYYYFIHNIFQKTGVCHSTRVQTNSNIQAYLGRKIAISQSQLVPKNFKLPGDNNTILIPFQQFIADKSEEETYKQISELVIHNMGWGYTCFVSAFAVFVSEREINTASSGVLKAFSSINSLDAF